MCLHIAWVIVAQATFTGETAFVMLYIRRHDILLPRQRTM
jgi:hypothetical protein